MTVTEDIPDGVDAILATETTRVLVEAAAALAAMGLKIGLTEARRLAWMAAIGRGDAVALTGLADPEVER